MRADVVVVGGGIIGVSTAYHLAAAGVDVILVERDQLASGSTSKAIGGIRASFDHPTNLEIGQYGLDVFSRFEEEFEQPIAFVRGGYLYLIDDSVPMPAIESAVALQESYGVGSRLITPEEAKTLSPMIDPDSYVAALWSPNDAKAEPESAVQGYARAARAHGAQIMTSTSVTGVVLNGSNVRAVVTDRGTIEAGAVIDCAGAWAPQIAAMVGLELPITPVRRQVVVTEPADVQELHRLTIDLSCAFYFHQEGRSFTIGYSDPLEEPGFKTVFDPTDWLPRMFERAERCAPGLLDLGVRSQFAGLYEVTPDHNQVVGEYPEVSRFLYAAGFSGHGFQMGPAIGRIMTEMYLGQTPFIDVSDLSVDRFADETGHAETFIV